MTTEEKHRAERICTLDKFMELVPGVEIEQGINGQSWCLYMRETDSANPNKLSKHWTNITYNLN